MWVTGLIAGFSMVWGSGTAVPVTLDNGAQYVPNQILIKFKTGSGERARSRAYGVGQATPREHIYTAAMHTMGEGGLILATTTRPVMDAIKALEALPEVEYAEPNWIYHHAATSNDPYFTGNSLWGMYGDASSPANAYGSQAAEAWANNHVGSSSVYVGVIDEGAMWAHEDLSANIWVNPYDPVDGVDNDGNGYVDDVRGWDFDGNNNTTYDGTQDDHGTHTTGTVGAVGGNGKGVAGVCWNVRVISCKFLGRNGGSTVNAIKALDYLTDLKTRHGLDIVASNNSWSGGAFSQALKDAITRHGNANILAVCAASNGGFDGIGDNNDVTPVYPASYTNDTIIAVASITSTGARSSFSNYGATSVDLGAPGSAVNSTLPGKNGASKYGSYNGTSMATPHVAGGAALYAATHAERGVLLKNAILAATIPTASLSSKCVTGGRLNVSGF